MPNVIRQVATAEGITEDLKRRSQWEWTRGCLQTPEILSWGIFFGLKCVDVIGKLKVSQQVVLSYRQSGLLLYVYREKC